MSEFKKVQVPPIITPNSGYCWDGSVQCEHLSIESGDYPFCLICLDADGLEYDRSGKVTKATLCLNLPEITP